MVKKNLFFSILLVLFSAVIFAAPLPFVNNNEYVYYTDLRGTTPYYTGYFTVNDDDCTIFYIRDFNLETEESVIFSAVFDIKDGEIDCKKISGKIDMSNIRVMTIIADILNFSTMYLNHSEEILYETEIGDTWDDFKTVYHFNKLFPVFKFTHLIYDGCEVADYYYADRFGLIRNDDDLNAFFYYVPLVIDMEERNVDLTIPKASSKKVKLNGITVKVDKNWEENDSLGQPGVWLKISSIRDSQVMVEKFPDNIPIGTKEDQEYLAKVILLNTKGIFAPTISLNFDSGNLYMDYMFVDDSKFWNWQLTKIVKGKLVNFSTFADIYLANEDYFKKILDSIK